MDYADILPRTSPVTPEDEAVTALREALHNAKLPVFLPIAERGDYPRFNVEVRGGPEHLGGGCSKHGTAHLTFHGITLGAAEARATARALLDGADFIEAISGAIKTVREARGAAAYVADLPASTPGYGTLRRAADVAVTEAAVALRDTTTRDDVAIPGPISAVVTAIRVSGVLVRIEVGPTSITPPTAELALGYACGVLGALRGDFIPAPEPRPDGFPFAFTRRPPPAGL